MIDSLSLNLLRRHIEQRSGAGTGLGQLLGTGDTSNTKIGDLDFALRGQHDISRLDIAVDDTLGMGVTQSVQYLQKYLENLRQGQGFVLKEYIAQRPPLDILHLNESGSLRLIVATDSDDIRMLQTGERHCFPLKICRQQLIRGDLGMEHFKRHLTADIILRQVNRTKPTFSQQLDNLILAEPFEFQFYSTLLSCCHISS